MPGLNGKGPTGMGPMTGRRMGRCNTNLNKKSYGLGLGNGFRRGAGFCRFFGVGLSKEDNKAFLENEKSVLEAHLENVKEQLKDYEEKE